MKFRPYVSVDIETTGLDLERSQILEIGAVFDDMESPIEELETFTAKIYYDHFEYAELKALSMNKTVIDEIVAKPALRKNVFTFTDTMTDFIMWLKGRRDSLRKYEDAQNRKYTDDKIHVAGKNVSAFDIPIIKNQMSKRLDKNLATEYLNEFESLVHFRYIDVGSLYMVDFDGYLPSLNDINRVTGRQKVSHRAVDDAFDVVCAIRHKFGVPFKV